MASVASIEAALDATDRLIDWLISDDEKLNDERFLKKLTELRVEHKKTQLLIESLYRDENEWSGYDEKLEEEYQKALEEREAVHYSYFVDPEFYDFQNPSLFWDSDPFYGEFFFDQYVTRTARSIRYSRRKRDESETLEANQLIETVGTRWTPEITIPQPFHMTIRDENAPLKATYSQKFVQNLVRNKSLVEKSKERVARKQFKARPPPASTYLPVYEEMERNYENRKKFLKDNCSEMLATNMKPFKLTNGSKYTQRHLRRCTSSEDLYSNPKFRANPIPDSIYNSGQFLGGNERKLALRKERAKKLLESSTLPNNMKDYSKNDIHQSLKDRRHKSRCYEFHSFSPQIRSKVPNFDALHTRFGQALEETKMKRNKTTVPKPFHLTQDVHKHTCRIGEFGLKKPKPLGRSRSMTQIAATPAKVRTNTTAILRTEMVRAQIQDLQEQAFDLMHYWEKKETNSENLKTRMTSKFQRQYKNETQKQSQKLDDLRKSNQTRTSEYFQELNEIQERVREGPTLLERQEILIRKQSVERRYEKVLKSAGLKPSKYRAKSAREVEEVEAEIEEFQLSPVAEKASSQSSQSSKKTKSVSEKAASVVEKSDSASSMSSTSSTSSSSSSSSSATKSANKSKASSGSGTKSSDKTKTISKDSGSSASVAQDDDIDDLLAD